VTSIIRGKCNMCGNPGGAPEVEIPHASAAHKKAAGVGMTGTLCAAVCETCARAITHAHARYNAAGFQQWAAEWRAARAYPEKVDT
jgi:hypothetical protein